MQIGAGLSVLRPVSDRYAYQNVIDLGAQMLMGANIKITQKIGIDIAAGFKYPTMLAPLRMFSEDSWHKDRYLTAMYVVGNVSVGLVFDF